MRQEKLKGGAAETAPRFLDKAGTIQKIGQTLEEAGRLGLDLLVFPETFLSAYPYWRGAVSVRRETELTAAMQRESVRIPSADTEELCEMARRARVNCVIGLNEQDDRPGSMTMYNSLLVISRDGRVAGRHRKLMPTHSQRVYWGLGGARLRLRVRRPRVRAGELDLRCLLVVVPAALGHPARSSGHHEVQPGRGRLLHRQPERPVGARARLQPGDHRVGRDRPGGAAAGPGPLRIRRGLLALPHPPPPYFAG